VRFGSAAENDVVVTVYDHCTAVSRSSGIGTAVAYLSACTDTSSA